jgi:hypothetical protein
LPAAAAIWPRVTADRRYPVASATWHRDTQVAESFPAGFWREHERLRGRLARQDREALRPHPRAFCASGRPRECAPCYLGASDPPTVVLVLGCGEEFGHERGDLCWALEQE